MAQCNKYNRSLEHIARAYVLYVTSNVIQTIRKCTRFAIFYANLYASCVVIDQHCRDARRALLPAIANQKGCSS